MKSISLSRNVTIDTIQGSGRVLVNGELTTLTEGATLPSGTQLGLPDSSDTVITLSDGTQLMIEPQSESPDSLFDALPQDVQDEIADIQQQILDGEGEITIQEDQATAAGQDATGSGSWSYVNVARDRSETIASSGFDSDSIANNAGAISTNQEDGFGRLVDTTAPNAPGVTILNDANNDGVISSQEIGDGIRVSIDLTGTNANPGDVLTVNGQTFTLTDDNITDGSVVVTLPDTPVDGEILTVDATITDTSGNTSAPGSDSATIDTSAEAGTVSVDNITADDVINKAESGQTIAVTGTAKGGDISEGDVVTMTINGTEYTTTVDGSGNWTVDVAGADLAADTEFDVNVASTDGAGNPVTSTGSSEHTVDLEADKGTVKVGDITADDVINKAESGQTIAVTGTAKGGDISEGDVVTMTINGTEYTTTVDGSGNWTVDVAGADLAADTEFDVNVASTDGAGNPVTSTGSSEHTVDLEADKGTVKVGDITADDVINKAESGQTIAVTGTAKGGDISEGDVVTMTINGTEYTTTVDGSGNWTVDVAGADLAADTEFDVNVASTDGAGNPVTSTGSSEHTVDLEADKGTVKVGDITADDVINKAESGQTIAVTGTAKGGDISEGDVVTMTINGTEYTTTVDGSGNWTVDVAGADLAADTEFDVNVASTDGAGNPVTSTGSSEHTVDLEADKGTVKVGDITADDVINKAESGQTIAVTGTAKGGDISEGDVVTMTINGTEYTTTVDGSGNWTVDVAGADLAADTEFDVNVASTDGAGNPVTSTGSSEHTVDLEADKGTVKVGDITADDVINKAESGQTIAVTGTAKGGDISEGDVVTMTINGTEYTTTVDGSGNWTVDVAGADLAADTEFDVNVASTDGAGNPVTSTGSSEHTVDLEADKGTVKVGDITADDVINKAESGQTIAVTGTAKGGDISEGDVVTMTINGTEYTTTVDGSGNWTVDVAGADLAADTEFDVNVASTDGAGNPVTSTGSSEHTVDLEADKGTVKVGDITADDVINKAESGQTIAVTGTAKGGDISEGDVVTMTINGTEYTTTVDGSGNWTVDVAGADLAADTEFDVNVASTDGAGNPVTSTGSSEHTVDLEADKGTVKVGDITADDVINKAESGQTIAVTGTAKGGDISEGDVVTMTINGTEYTTTVDGSGNWTVDVAGADLAADTEFDVNVASTDGAGNPVTSTGSSEHTVDLEADKGTVKVGDITADDVINKAESGQTIAVTGTAKGGDISEGDVVTMTINGTEYTTTVDGSGNWTVDVAGADLAADTEFDVNVASTDGAGNPVTSTGSSEHTVDLEADKGTVKVGDITADDVINKAESGQTIAVTGTAKGGDISEGDVVTMTINGTEYTTTVDGSGNWTVDVAGADLAADTEFDVNVASTDGAGNPVTSTGSSEHTVDLEADKGTVKVGDITADDVINKAESGQTIAVTGTAKGGDISEGDVVTMTINGTEYTTTVDGSGNWTVDVAGADLAADTEFDVNVASTDGAGNPVTSTGSSEHTVDLEADKGTVKVGDITADDVINKAESGQTIAVTGTAKGGDISEGDVVTMTINGTEYTTTVDGSGNWTVDVAGADLAADTEFDVNVASTDGAGNPVTSTGSSEHTVDLEADKGTVKVGDITADDVINKAESGQTIAVTGTAKGGDISEGDVVTMTINGTEYTTTVDGSGNWTVDVAGADLAADTEFDVNVASTDGAGNPVTSTGSSEHTVDLEADKGTVKVGDITADDVINKAESGQTIAVTGTAKGGDISEGDVVTMTINGTEYTTTVDGSGNWTVDVAGADLAADTEFDVNVASTDGAGNPVTSTGSSEHTVDLEADKGTVKVGDITADDVINKAESGQTIAVTGTAKGGDISEGDVVTMTINGTEYTTTVDGSGNWTVDVAGADLAADTEFDVNVASTDGAGNPVTSTGSSEHTVDLEADKGTVKVGDITADDVINKAESGQTIAVTGTAKGGDISEGDVVTMTINGTEYTTTVDGSGNWTVDVAGADLAADTEFDVNVASTDGAGNPVTSTGSSEHTVDLEADKGTVKVGDITADDVINKAESGQTIAVTGTAKGGDISEGDVVTMTINGTEYTTTVDGSGNWTVDVAGADLAADTEFDVNVASTDGAGNPVTSTGSSEHTVDLEADKGTVKVGDITADDVINKAESGQTIAVTGTAKGGDISEGDVVTMTINGTEYTTTVDGSGNWTVDVAGADLAADTEFDVNVASTDGAGNPVTSTGSSEHTVDLEADKGTVKVGDITADDVINKAESGQTIAVTGTAKGGDISEGDVVTMTINGTEYTTTVDGSGNWTVDVAGADLAADTEFDVNVASTDGAGNPVTSTGSSEHTVDLEADKGTVKVGDITADDVINKAESGQTIAVTGTAKGGDISEGDVVTMTINGTEYTTTVDGSGNWTVDVAGADLAADTEFDVNVASTDGAGNPVTSTGSSEHTVDFGISKPTIDLVASSDSGDSDTDNLTNDTTPTFALGNIDSDAVRVEVFLGSTSLGFAAKGSNDNWMFTPQKLLSAGAYNFTVQVTDSAGNSDISDGLQVTIDTSASATITIDTIADDDVVNEQEASGDVTVTGAVGGDAKPGDTVTLTLQAAGDDVTTYTGIVKDDGTYSINVPGSALVSDADSAIVASVTGTDKAGNPFTATTSPSGENKDGDYEVDIDAPNPPIITNITDDSAGSDYSDVTMHGTGEPGATISIYFEGESGTPLVQATVDTDGSWTVALEDIASIGINENVRLEAVQSDAAGNQSEPSDAVHYWHGSWVNANTEAGDDYVLTGESNDTVNIITDDANDQLVIDGGAGTDKAVFNTRVDHLSFSKDSNGYLIVENSDTGDRIELRDFETINIDGDEKHIDELFTPTVTISEDANDDGVITANELNGDVDVIVGLPLGASVGDTIRISDGTTTNEIVLAEADIDNGSVATSFDAPAEGETLTVTAELEDQIGNTSEPGSDSAVLDTQYGGEDGEDPSDIRLPNIVITDSTADDNDDVITNSETAEITIDFGEGVTAGSSTIVLRDSSGNDPDVELQLVWDNNGPRINVISGELDANALTLSGQNGLFTISGIDVSNLQDGGIDAFASFIDQDGNVATNVNGDQWFDDSVVKSFAPVITIGSGVNVSEEGLDGGNADSTPTGTDTTNSPSVSGEFAVTGGVGNVTVALAGGSGLTSNGEAVAWTWDASTNRLIGYTSTTNPVVSIALNEPTPGNEVWTYDVELHGSLDHSDSQTEDTLALPINVVVSDDNHTGLSKPLSVTVEDDSPETTAVEAIPVELQDIPDVLTGKVSFTGQGSGSSVTFDDVTVTALGFANDYNTQLEYDKVNLSSDGIGVDSGYSRYWGRYDQDEHGHPLSNEIEYRITETGQGVSEQLIFSLNGKVAYGAQIEFSKMYGGELESGIVRFYRDGQLIAEKAFTSDEASGDYAKNFDIQEGGFDQITIEATDNGNRNGPDNSDLTVKSITFTGASDQQAIAIADGTLQYHAGADGLGSLKLTGVEDGLRTAEGLAITTRFDGNNRLIATDENGALVFEVQLTPVTGKWEFYQYQVVQTPEGDADIDFSYQVTDGDGDSATGEFSVQPANVPAPQNHLIETGDGVDQIDMLQNADSGWLALNVGLSGSEKVVINDESFIIDGPETHRMSDFVSDWRMTDNHVIDAGGGDDNVRGGEGDDVLIGGRGSDMLTGSDGADTFSWSMADVNSQNGHEYTDTVSDFSAEDTLNLNDLFKGDSVNGEFSRFSVTVSDDNDNDGKVDVTLKFDYDTRQDADQTIELSNVKMEGGTVVINTLIDGERGAITIDKHNDGSISVTSNHDALDDIRIDTDW